jgi:hypothetical protein
VCLSVVFLGRDTGLSRLLAPNLLMGGKNTNPVIRVNVVLNKSLEPVSVLARSLSPSAKLDSTLGWTHTLGRAGSHGLGP